MFPPRGTTAILRGVLILLSLASSKVQAQKSGGGVQPMCHSGCGGSYSVSVSPDGSLAIATVSTSGQTTSFTVHNTGSAADSYNLSCSATDGITCGGISPDLITLDPAEDANVTVTFSTDATGSGTLTLTAAGNASDDGSYVMADAVAPALSLNPYSGNVRTTAACAAACFDLIWSHATPAYNTLSVARAFAIVYSSAAVRPTPVIQLDVTRQGGPVPTSYKVEVRRTSDNALLTLLNGQTSAYFAASSTFATTRVAAALDAVANGLGTGVTEVAITITANFAAAAPKANTITTRIASVDRNASVFGTGVSPVPRRTSRAPVRHPSCSWRPTHPPPFIIGRRQGRRI